MTKFTGLVGYVTQEQSAPGVWSPVENPKMMRGDFISQASTNGNGSHISDTGKVNDDVSLNHRVSLLGDTYAFNNFMNLKWIQIGGKKFEISSVELRRPRLIVSVGGVYRGK